MNLGGFCQFRLLGRTKLVLISKYKFRIVLVIAISIFTTSCKQAYTPEKARKYLIAADQELMNAVQKTINSDAFSSISYLYKLETAPLPGKKFPIGNGNIPILFDMQTHSGYYRQTAEGEIEFLRASDSLIFDFNLGSNPPNSEKIIISAYQKEMTAIGDSLPVKLDVVLFSNAKTIMDFRLNAEMQYGLPKTLNMKLIYGRYTLDFESEINFGKKYSILMAELVMKSVQSEVFNAKIKTKVKISEAETIVYEVKDLSFSVFPILFLLKSNFLFDNISLKTFVHDFNRTTSMRIVDKNGRELVKLFLKEVPDSDQLNLFVRYSDGSTENLEDIMLSAQSILQFKLKH